MSSKNPLVWLITGTSSGFGRSLVRSVLDRGDRVIASARSIDKLNEDLDLAGRDPDALSLLKLDVTSGEQAIKKAVAEAAAIWGRIDVLVNNAGIGLSGLLEEGGSDLLRRQFETNVFGLMDVTTATLPYMRAQKLGTIVNIGSRTTWKTEFVGIGFYGSSKAAVHAISETLALEVAPFNIRVLLVAPGSFRTGIYSQPYFTSKPLEDYDVIRAESQKRFASVPGTEKGDPDKAMEVLVDTVRDAEQDVRVKTSRVIGVLDKWGDVAREVVFS
ncbi:short-chain dehydrogenases/reductases (SDR) family protein [Pleurotus pulmonarius]